MAGKKYEKYVFPLEAKALREGALPNIGFKAQQIGIDVSWGILAEQQPPDEATRQRLFENPHRHPHHQIITYFGSNPLNLGDFDAEISVCLGEEREEHIITRPTVLHFPPGLVHAYGKTPHKYYKPVYHLDMTFSPEYVRENLP